MKKDIDRERRLEDTLDYYDESLTINAVGSLLNNSNIGHDEVAVSDDTEGPKSERVKEDLVRGFAREEKEEPREYLYNKKLDYTKSESLNRQKREVKYPEGYEPPSRKEVDRKTKTHKTCRPNTRYKAFSEDYAFDYAEADEGVKSISTLKVIGIVAFFMFLGILVFLVYKVNSVTRQLEHIQALEVSSLQPSIDVDSLIKQRDELIQQVTALETTVTDLQQQVEGLNNPNTDQQNVTSQGITQVPVNPESTGLRTHTVQQGENLSTISERFYGARYDYQRIIDANNLQTDFLDVGQILIIP